MHNPHNKILIFLICITGNFLLFSCTMMNIIKQEPPPPPPAPIEESLNPRVTHPGYFTHPVGITLDWLGNIYVVDSENHRIQKFKPDRKIAGNSWGRVDIHGNPEQGNGEKEFSSPNDLAVDNNGDVYVVDTGNARIQKFTADGTYIKKYENKGRGKCQFLNPVGISIDLRSNYIYVTDNANYSISILDENLECVDWVLGDIPRKQSRTSFVTSLHGFKFTNTFGLCGGMCFTALDYFFKNERLPDRCTKSLNRTLWQKQRESIQGGTGSKFLELTNNPNAEELKALTVEEFSNLQENIDAGVPVVLGLVKASRIIKIMDNHQVVAVGYDIYEIGNNKNANIYLYDPSSKDEQVMTLIFFASPERFLQYKGKTIRGFFINNTYRQPSIQ